MLIAASAALAAAWAAFPFPEHRLNQWSVSPSVLDSRGRPILTIVGPDDQWRRPILLQEMSPWLVKATIAVEDQRFFEHPGVDLLAIGRAAGSNLVAGRVVSGASTLDMQICRMMEPRPRRLWAKAIESLRALQLNQLRSKKEIIELYLNTAPYGGNIRGVGAAAWRYFGKRAAELSLAEAALLAGLPQAPSRHRPDRFPDQAKTRRSVVLERMAEEGVITDQQRRRADAEPVVVRKPVTDGGATHAAWLALRRRPSGGRITLDLDIQREVQRLVNEHARRLPQGVEAAVVVLDVAQSALVALIGSADANDPVDGQVNAALAARSPGSALKPFLYAAAFEAGRLGADSIIHDVPVQRGGWAPSNFDRTFAGPVPVDEALRRSLNVPAILVVEGAGLSRCCGMLSAVGIRLPANVQARGGLAVAVGGIEVTLLDLTNAYATLARRGVRGDVRIFADEPPHRRRALSENVCAVLDEILSSRRRRPRSMEDLGPADVPWFMWKTGTSAGRRDAWAVGHNRRYAIGVWAGRFRGTGEVSLVGAKAAEPLLAALFNLPALRTFDYPSPAEPIPVRSPLLPPVEAAERLHVLAPCDGATFLALNGQTIIRPRTNRAGPTIWFLNGQALDARNAERLILPPGQYELRSVCATGRTSDAVRFRVLADTPPMPGWRADH